MKRFLQKSFIVLGEFWHNWWGVVVLITFVIILLTGVIMIVNSSTSNSTSRCNREEDTVNLIAQHDPQDLPRVLEMFRYDCGQY